MAQENDKAQKDVFKRSKNRHIFKIRDEEDDPAMKRQRLTSDSSIKSEL